MAFYSIPAFQILLALCADAPPADAIAARRLLARELVARLKTHPIAYDTSPYSAWLDVGGSSLGPGHRGPADFYRLQGRAQPRLSGVARPIPASAVAAYDSVLSQVQAEAATLIASTTIEPSLLDASVANQVARLEPFGSADPGDPVPFYLLGATGTLRPPPVGYSVNGHFPYHATELTIPDAVPYFGRLRARVRSASTSPNTEITLAFAIGGSPIADATVVRASSNPGEAVTIELENNVGGVLTILNGSPTHVQTVEGGIVRVWPSGGD